MFDKLFALIAVFVLLLAPPAIAHDDGKPTIAIARFGTLRTFDTTEGAVLDVLESYGWINSEENAILHKRENHEGEKLHVIWGAANFDTTTATLMLQQLLDQDPDVLVTLTTTVTQLALLATSDMENPPVVIFTSVYNPYEAGILDGPCDKPAHVTGSISAAPYSDVMSLLISQNPDIEKIGTIYNIGESAGVIGAQEITRIGEELGLTVLAQPVAEISDINLAAETLVDDGIDAFVMPIDLRTGAAGLPIIVNLANEFAIPVFHPILFSIYYGATISSGFYHYYAQGDNVGVMLAHYLNGDLDIANTGVNEQTGSAIGINLDSAGRQGIEIANDIIEQADAVIAEGEATISPHVGAELRTGGAITPLDDRLEADLEMLASLACDASADS